MSSFSPVVTTQLDSELATFAEMLRYKRPAGSKTERAFIRQFIAPLGAEADVHGNYWVVVGKSRVMWSSHTDTVHKEGGPQEIEIVQGYVAAKASDCLGADCTTGVWLMRQMILAKVPGIYVFHRSEERGGVGSSMIARKGDERLNGVEFAIAFDRKGTDSVITHQMGLRCASQAFVDSIAPMLPGAYKADDGGSFTDTANYVDMIPECTNISVGYYDQHTSKESQDLAHAIELAQALLVFDESRLVAERDPTVEEEFDRLDMFDYLANDNLPRQVMGAWSKASRSVYDVVCDYPNEVADLLEQYGYDVKALMSELNLN
jgi:hypothetical protein